MIAIYNSINYFIGMKCMIDFDILWQQSSQYQRWSRSNESLITLQRRMLNEGNDWDVVNGCIRRELVNNITVILFALVLFSQVRCTFSKLLQKSVQKSKLITLVTQLIILSKPTPMLSLQLYTFQSI